jgi:hypothetical protein
MMRRTSAALVATLLLAGASSACEGILSGDDDAAGKPGADGEEAAPPPVAGLSCGDPNAVRTSDLRRLNRRELANTYQAAFGADAYGAIQDSVALLGSGDEIRRDPSDLSASFGTAQFDAIDRISRRLAAFVTGSDAALTAVAGACSLTAAPDAACVSAFVSRTGKLLFRRPLAAQEVATFADVFGRAASSREGFGDVITTMVLAPDFLYHVELGDGQGGSNAQFKLTKYELASRIAYLTTDSPPDAALTAAADDGSLADPAVVSAQVDRLLQSELGRAKVLRFVNYWLLLDRFQGLPSAPAYLEGVDTTGLTAEMRRELDAFVLHVTYEKRGSFKDLLTSRRSFAQTAALAKIYGQPLPAAPTDEVSTDASRMGLLLRSPVLADGSNTTHPIVRGAFMLRRIVCNEIGSPSPADLAAREAATFVADPAKYSTGEMTVQRTSSAACQGCHSQINPFGLSLEGFDNLGRARTKETMLDAMGVKLGEHPVSTSANVTLSAKEKATVAAAPELMAALASSEAAPLCFTRHVYRFFRMQRETDADDCQLTSMYRVMQDPKGSILQNIRASIVNVSLDQRRVQ